MSSLDNHPGVKAAYWFPDGATPGSGDCPQKIDSSLFTHLFCAFADIDSKTHKVFVSLAHESIFSTFTPDVRKKNPHVKTLLSIGGKTANMASMASNSTTRKAFIDSSISIARSMNFNGLDLAWEYPNDGTEMTNFGKLLKEWRLAIDAETTGRPRLLLTASVYYSPSYKRITYPVGIMKENLNWVNIIAYDFYTPATSNVTTPTAALYDPSGEGTRRNGDSGLEKWIDAGLKNQAVFGFSYVGWAFTLLDAEQHDYNAPTQGPAIAGDGSTNYDQIRQFIGHKDVNKVHNDDVVEDYCYGGTTWIAFQDEQTVTTKVTYAKDKGLLGYFAWNVTADVNSTLSTAASKAWDA